MVLHLQLWCGESFHYRYLFYVWFNYVSLYDASSINPIYPMLTPYESLNLTYKLILFHEFLTRWYCTISPTQYVKYLRLEFRHIFPHWLRSGWTHSEDTNNMIEEIIQFETKLIFSAFSLYHGSYLQNDEQYSSRAWMPVQTNQGVRYLQKLPQANYFSILTS